MKRLLFVLACCAARTAAAQMMVVPVEQITEPAYVPQNVVVKGDGRCMTVHPGDIVHYTLTIQGVVAAPAVFSDLRLRLGHSRELTRGGLPLPDFRSLGGGGTGTRDEGSGTMFHFSFTVPGDIYGGIYRGTDVFVRADQAETLSQPAGLHDRGPKVEVTRHTRDEIHAYCLNVLSNFGVETRPAVTNFEPGQIDPAAAQTPQQQLAPLPTTTQPVPLRPVPQPQ